MFLSVGALAGITGRDETPQERLRRSPLILHAGLIAVMSAAALLIGLPTRSLVALPLYARQTGQPCAACHTAFPELTPFGRRFKLGGYTMGGGESSLPPIAVMLQPTFTRTEVGQPGGAAPHFGPNNNLRSRRSVFSPAAGSRIISELSFRVLMTESGAGSLGTIPISALLVRASSAITTCCGV